MDYRSSTEHLAACNKLSGVNIYRMSTRGVQFSELARCRSSLVFCDSVILIGGTAKLR